MSGWDWSSQPLEALIEHLMEFHHGRLGGWIEGVATTHVLGASLREHIRKQEQVLFPAILRAEGWTGQAIPAMQQENAQLLEALAEIEDGEMRESLRNHLEFENGVLFPRALAELERSRGC